MGYFVNGHDKNSAQLRYTQNQRRKELKTKNNNKIRNDIKKVDEINEVEKKLSKFKSKSTIAEVFEKYIKEKFNNYTILTTTYNKPIIRKLKLQAYRNKLKSEQNLIKNFKNQFVTETNNNQIVICVGDWSQQRQMKFKEPTIGISLRRMFRRAGYLVYLVNEVLFIFNIILLHF